MKQRILLLSLTSSLIATGCGIAGILSSNVVGVELGVVFGLLGICSFFVGLASPASTGTTTGNIAVVTNGGSTKTRKAANS